MSDGSRRPRQAYPGPPRDEQHLPHRQSSYPQQQHLDFHPYARGYLHPDGHIHQSPQQNAPGYTPYLGPSSSHHDTPAHSQRDQQEVAEAGEEIENPWPSGEALSRALEEEAKASGGTVNILASKQKRAQYVRGDVGSSSRDQTAPAGSHGNESSSSEKNDLSSDLETVGNIEQFPPLLARPPRTRARDFAPGPDSNNAIVGQKTRSWVVKSPPARPPTLEQVADADESSWLDSTPAEIEREDKETKLKQWVESVPPISPERDIEPDYARDGQRLADGDDDDFPARPDSARPIPPPHIALVSDDESSDESEALPTPKAIAEKPKPPTILSVVNADGSEVDEAAADADDGAERSVDRHEPPMRSNDRGSGRGRGQPRGLARSEWWRLAPHPVYTPTLSDRRLFITFPVPLREDALRNALVQHFARYGTIRGAFHLESNGQYAEKGAVVFDEAASVDRCLADPRREIFGFQSEPLVARTEFEIKIERLHPLAMSRLLIVQVTGPRDHRPRSASPLRRSRRQHDEASADASSRASNDNVPYTHLPLPHRLVVYSKPAVLRSSGKVRHWPTILEPAVSWVNLSRRLKIEAGKEPRLIAEVDTSPRVPERDFIPRLCDILAELIDARPLNAPGGGWQIRVAGPSDGRRIIEELGKVPGISVRHATPGEDRPPFEDQRRLSLTSVPRSTFDQPAAQGSVRSDAALHRPPPSAMSEVPSHPHPASVRGGHSVSDRNRSRSVSTHSINPETLLPPFHHPFLRRELVYLYKDGRQVEREDMGASAVFIDKRAIHISRLVKEKETKVTLLDRFKVYGSVAHLEYNPSTVNTTYATARVLYHERDAAVRARDQEDGKVSFGSAIKVVERIVQDRDVEVEQVLLDPYGNVISPAAAEQYSPPRPEALAPPIFASPPPPMYPHGHNSYHGFPPPPPPGSAQHATPAPTYGPMHGPVHPVQPAPPMMMMPFFYGHPPPPPLPSSTVYPSTQPTSTPLMTPPPSQDQSVNSLIPAIQAMGIYCAPPMWMPFPFAPPQTLFAPNPSPPLTPHAVSAPPLPPSTAPLPTPPLTQADIPMPMSTADATIRVDHPAGGLRVTKFEWHQGEFKPVYHADDLKAWYESRGLEAPSGQPVAVSFGGRAELDHGEADKEVIGKNGDKGGEGDEGSESGKTVVTKPTLVPVPVPFSPTKTREEIGNIYPRPHSISAHYHRRTSIADRGVELAPLTQPAASSDTATQRSPVEQAVMLPSGTDTAHRPIERKTSWRKKVPSLDYEDASATRERRRVPLQPPAEVHDDGEAGSRRLGGGGGGDGWPDSGR